LIEESVTEVNEVADRLNKRRDCESAYTVKGDEMENQLTCTAMISASTFIPLANLLKPFARGV